MGGTVKVPEVLAAQGIERLFEDEFHGFRSFTPVDKGVCLTGTPISIIPWVATDRKKGGQV